jgi:hypothetical protein
MEMRSAAQPVRGNSFTIEEALEHIGFGWTQLIMFFFVGIAWAGDGMEMMLLSYLGPEVSSQSHHYFMRAQGNTSAALHRSRTWVLICSSRLSPMNLLLSLKIVHDMSLVRTMLGPHYYKMSPGRFSYSSVNQASIYSALHAVEM